jgi:hypothetical protein
MAFKIGYSKRRAQSVRTAETGATVRKRVLLLFRKGSREVDAVLDVSATGLKFLAGGDPLSKGDRLDSG